MKIWSLALMVLVLAPEVRAEPMELKGITIGMSASDVAAKYPKFFCSNMESGNRVCGDFRPDRSPGSPLHHPELETFGGEKIKGFYVTMRDGVVSNVRVRLDSNRYLPVTTALTAKYGAPAAKETSVVKNRMGAEFDQEEQTWKAGDERIIAKRRGSTLTEMEVSLISERQRLQQIEEMKEKAKASTKDL